MTGELGKLLVFSDFVCPFCYLADVLLARAAGDEEPRIEYRPYELRPVPYPVMTADDPRVTSGWDSVVAPLARELDIEIRRPEIFPRTRKAHEAALFGSEHGAAPFLHRAIFQAYFVRGEDIGRIDVLVGLGEEAGIERTSLKVALDIDQYTDRVVALESDARLLGIQAVPTIVAGETRLVGLQPPEVLRQLVQSAEKPAEE